MPNGYITLVCGTIWPTLWQEGLFERLTSSAKTSALARRTERVLRRRGAGHSDEATLSSSRRWAARSLMSRYHGLSADHIEI